MELEIVPPASIPLSSAEHESFAQAVARGTPAAIAYREHCAEGCTQKTSWENASKLLNSAKVAPRVQFLRAEAGMVAIRNYGVDADTLLRMHLEIATTPVGQIDENHPLCSKLRRKKRVERVGDDKEQWIVEEVSMPCKTRSLEAIADLCGFNAATKAEATVKRELGTEDLVGNLSAMNSFGWFLRNYPEAAQELINGLEGRVCGDNGDEVERGLCPVLQE